MSVIYGVQLVGSSRYIVYPTPVYIPSLSTSSVQNLYVAPE